MEWLIRSKTLKTAFYLAMVVIGLIVIFNDYAIEVHMMNPDIHLLEQSDQMDKDGSISSASLKVNSKHKDSLPYSTVSSEHAVLVPKADPVTVVSLSYYDHAELKGFSSIYIPPPQL
jgi:hypothetical protein